MEARNRRSGSGSSPRPGFRPLEQFEQDVINFSAAPSPFGGVAQVQNVLTVASPGAPVKPPRSPLTQAHPQYLPASVPGSANIDISEVPTSAVPQQPFLQPMPGQPRAFQCPVAPEIVRNAELQYRNVDEFKYMTYTPVTCLPEDFPEPGSGYALRQNTFGRKTELCIAVTMYNESDEFLIKTLSAVFRNIRYFCRMREAVLRRQRARSGQSDETQEKIVLGAVNNSFTYVKPRTMGVGPSRLDASTRGDQIWDEAGWQKIVVVIIADGRTKCHPRVLKMLQAMGAFHEDICLREALNEDNTTTSPVTAHLYEYTCQSILGEDLTMSSSKNGIVPVQMLFCLKEQNKKKLDSHKWLFRAFAPLLDPYVCVLIDVGTIPTTNDAIYRLWRAFDRNLRIAGACGEITVSLGKGLKTVGSVLHPLVASQNFEYKMANILDKTLESCFGYISVLPGAFSAYRWEALQDVHPDSGPLVSYFKGEHTKPNEKGSVFLSNMYLAEDRILCFELLAKPRGRWLLHYVKDSRAETDVPASLPEFMSQRRRWLNGSFFCQIYYIFHFGRFLQTEHSSSQKFLFIIQFLYSFVNLAFNWFSIGNFYLAFYFLMAQSLKTISRQNGDLIMSFVQLLYTAVIISLFICSMGNRPQGAKSIFTFAIFILSMIVASMFVFTAILIVQTFQLPQASGINWFLNGGTSRDVVISLISTYGLYLVSSLFYGEIHHIISCVVQYLLLLPGYINVLMIYAFCNSHDISWGTKGDNKVEVGATAKKVGDPGKTDAKTFIEATPRSIPVSTLSKLYQRTLDELSTRPRVEKQHRDNQTRREDHYKIYRTWLVLSWVLSNGLLVAIFTSSLLRDALIGPDSAKNSQNVYLAFIMYTIAVLAFIRFVGCVWYLFLRVIRGY